MEHLLQENIPRLLPSWHDLSVQDLMRVKSHKRFFQDKLPDFGGTGVGVSNDGKFYLTKHATDNVTFKAEVCSLPFLPPCKVSLKSDPCLMALNTSKAELNKFCVTLDYLKRLANVPHGKFQKDILSSHNIAKEICSGRSKKGKLKFTVPDTVMELATKIPSREIIPEANFDYLGGCLTSSQSPNESHILLHPVGKKLNKLGLTPLEETCSPDKTFQPVPSASNRVKMGKGCIEKIKSAFPGHCFVQQGKFCQYVNFTDLSNIYSEQVFRKQGNIINIEASPYIPYELISIDEKGILELCDIDTWQTVWNSLKACSRISRITEFRACTFGSHPRSVLSLGENSVYIYDIRSSKKINSEILFSGHFSSFPEEKYLNIKHLSVINPFQHLISTTNHVYICDERYPKVPVLIWSHMFKSSPLYCDVACYNPKDCDTVALLGSQESCELTLFTVKFSDSQIQPISLNTPMLLSSPSDCIDSLKLHGMHIDDDLIKRIMNPLAGVCAIPHSKKVGFTAFQLTSFGDVFYQDLKPDSPNEEHTYRVDTGCVLTPPERILPHLSEWTSFFSKHAKETDSERNNLVSINVDLKDILNNSSDLSSGCDLCNSNTKEFLTTSSCSSCGLNSIQVEKTLDAFSNLGLLAGPVVENGDVTTFDVSSLSDFTDAYSQQILKAWTEKTKAISSSSPDHSEASRISLDSTRSGTGLSSVARNLNSAFDDTQGSDTVKSQRTSFHNILSQDDTMSEYPFASQESTEDFVPPSQDIRPIIGETLKTPCKAKVKTKMNTSFAGF